MGSDEPSSGDRAHVATGLRHSVASDDRAAIINLQERERVRVGFDLHDGPAQTMSAALLQVRMLQGLEGSELTTGLSELRATLTVALEEIYDLIEDLGGRGSVENGLVARVQACVEGFAARCDIEPTLEIEGDFGPGSRSLQIAVFRIVQEALSNVMRHSGASRVRILLSRSPDGVLCEVSDDGRGFTIDDATTAHRSRDPYGLHSMSERAQLLDGTCTIDSSPGRGTRVRVEIPVWQA
jgi:two-component system sensor histidine kinase DegS